VPTPARRAAAAVVLSTALLATAGCEASVATRVEVTSATTTDITAVVRFTGEAASKIAGDPKTETELIKAITSRTGGQRPERTGDAGELVYTVPVTFEQLTASSDVLGISTATLSGNDDDATVRITLAQPEGLLKAIVAATANEPDAAVLAETMAKATTVDVNVVFPGGVTKATGPAGVDVTVDGDTATLVQTAAQFTTGELVVNGDPTLSAAQRAQRLLLSWWGLAGLAVLAAGGGTLFWRRWR
jgi:hypothetical protein